MVQRCQDACLALESCEAIGFNCEARRQDLDGDVTSEPRVPRPVDFTHPTTPERADDLIRAYATPGGQHDKVSLPLLPIRAAEVGSQRAGRVRIYWPWFVGRTSLCGRASARNSPE